MKKINNPKTLIIIPAYNEEEAIPETLRKLLSFTNNFQRMDICVVNDGSLDSTLEKVKEFPVTVLNLPFNLGIGGAMQTGYKYAYYNDYDIAIQFDADGQHNQEDLTELIEMVASGNADMSIGSRFLIKTDYKGTIMRKIGILHFCLLLKIVTGKRFTDPTSGFRAKNRRVLEHFAKDYPRDYPEPEVLIFLEKQGLNTREISASMHERQGGVSSITPLKSVYYMVKVSLAIFMQWIKKGST